MSRVELHIECERPATTSVRELQREVERFVQGRAPGPVTVTWLNPPSKKVSRL
jgi:hypothetical protein